MTQSYSATGVKTNIASQQPGFSNQQYYTVNSNHFFTILSNNNGIINWKDEVTFEGVGEGQPGKYTIYGVGFQRKVGNKIFYELNGSGFLNTKGNLSGVVYELFYSVYTKMSGELCKSGNIKFRVDENGTTTKFLINDIIADYNYNYAANYEFCAKRLIQ
jgi:hypothetical protein